VIKVLAVDDSALMRRLIAELFAEEDEFDVSFARNGVEALAMLHEQQPDVVTLDIHMPKMDGLACLDRIMVERPCPVVMFSSLTADGARETVEALSLGAVDFVPKPSGAISLKLDEFGPLLIDKVRAASKARLARTHRLAERVRLRSGVVAPPPKRVAAPRITRRRPVFNGEAGRVVLVGCSTGGPSPCRPTFPGRSWWRSTCRRVSPAPWRAGSIASAPCRSPRCPGRHPCFPAASMSGEATPT